MKLKQFLSVLMLMTFSVSVLGQSLEEGIKMYRYERYQSAKKALEPLAASNPEANYYLGLSELALGNTTQAQTIFSKYPENYANLGGLARVEFANGNSVPGMQKATALEGMGKRKDWIPTKYAADAVTYSKDANKQQAVTWYEEVMEKIVTAEILIATGDAYQQIQGGGGKAMTSYEKAVEKAENTSIKSLAYSRIGKLWYEAKNYELALENWEKAKEADPSNPLPYRDLANAYTYVGKYQIAKENLEKYLERSDKSVDDQVRYVEILFLAKDCSAATSKINQLSNEGISKPNFYGILAYCYMEETDSVSAVKALENVRKYFAFQEKSKLYKLDYLNYGRIMLNNELNDSADVYFSKALAMDTTGEKMSTYREIAESFKSARSWENAGNWYKKILDEYPNEATATDYFWSGVSYYYGQKYEVADTVFADMISKFPDQPSGFYWRARVNTALDQEAEEGLAVPYYNQWLDLEIDGYERKSKDLMIAYQYLALYYYKKDDKANSMKYVDMILEIDGENQLGNQIKEFFQKA